MDTKTALVLAGGGVTGAVYELGAVKALEARLAPGGRTANDFDIYVGTSAGAIVGSLLANGIAVEVLCQLLAGQHPTVRGLRQDDVFKWNGRGLARWALALPRHLARAAGRSLRQRRFSPLLRALTEATPPGLYDGLALAQYLRQAYAQLGGTDRFDALARDLYLVATNLNTGQRVVFGRGQAQDGVSISQAVAASTALPFVYAPVRLGEAWYADGGLRGNASPDVAIEQGARLVVCINPLVPYTPEHDPDGAELARNATTRAMRIGSHAALHYHLKHLRQRHPEVDLLLIEPRADDAEFLNVPFMDFEARQALLEHGCQAVHRHLTEHYAEIAPVLARHGLHLRPPAAPVMAWPERAARPGSTHERHPAAETSARPRLARPGNTGARAGGPRGAMPALREVPLSAKGDSQAS